MIFLTTHILKNKGDACSREEVEQKNKRHKGLKLELYIITTIRVCSSS